MQTSIMFENGLSNQQIAEACKSASDVYACFISLGRDNSNSVRLNNLASALEVCEVFSAGNERACVDGLVYALIDNTWDAKYAYAYCEGIKNTTTKQICYLDSHYYLKSTYVLSKDDLNKQCETYAVNEKDFCKKMVEEISK